MTADFNGEPKHGEIRIVSEYVPERECWIARATLYFDPRKVIRNQPKTPSSA